jgi:hypothetical protein
LERQREKLMQAHYADAIPLEVLKREQERIAASLLQIASKLEASSHKFDEVARNLQAALDLTVDCALAYRSAPDHLKRQFNQAFFRRILVAPTARLCQNSRRRSTPCSNPGSASPCAIVRMRSRKTKKSPPSRVSPVQNRALLRAAKPHFLLLIV